MKNLTSKQIARQEKKKEKMAALVAISKLNDHDRFKASAKQGSPDPHEPLCKKQKKELEDSSKDSMGDQNVNILEPNTTKALETLKKDYQDYKLRRRPHPAFKLKATGEKASLESAPDERIPILLTDVQHLLLLSLMGDECPYHPLRWCTIEKFTRIKHTVTLVIENVSLYHYTAYESILENINRIFTSKVEVVTPSLYNGSLVEEIATVPLSQGEEENLLKMYGTMDVALESRKDLMIMMKAVFAVGNEVTYQNDESQDRFPRTQLVMSAWQLLEEGYPVPLKGKMNKMYSDYVLTKDVYAPVTEKSPMFALDCEMCLTSMGNELTRISVVDENHKEVYESLVLPHNKIYNYLTQYSGITAKMMENVTTRLEDVQKDLRKLLPPDAILIGQSLNADLHALKMMHPYVIDTSVIFNTSGVRNRKCKLKVLVKEFLNENIQVGNNGHCSVEDSLGALKLVQLKLNKSMDFGDAVLVSKKKFTENKNKALKHKAQCATTIFNHMLQQKKSFIIVGCENITGDYHDYLKKVDDTILFTKKGKQKKVKLCTMESHEEVVEKVCSSASKQNSILAHMKMSMVEDTTECEQHMRQVDGWVQRVYHSLAEDSLFVVVLGGSEHSNGVVFANVVNHEKLNKTII